MWKTGDPEMATPNRVRTYRPKHSDTSLSREWRINMVNKKKKKKKYHKHQWLICVDLKMIYFPLGQQCGYTNYPCFMCLWNRHACDVFWEKKEWPPRIDMTVNEPLVLRDKIIIPPLHIKLGLMKQFVKALLVNGCYFNYICKFFPGMRTKNLKQACLMAHRFERS